MAASELDPAFSFICSNVLKIGKFHIKKLNFRFLLKNQISNTELKFPCSNKTAGVEDQLSFLKGACMPHSLLFQVHLAYFIL